MTQLVEVPGMGQVEFPDGMSDEQIASAIKANMPQHGITIHGKQFSAPWDLPSKMIDALQGAAYKAGGAVTDATGSPAAGYATNVAIQSVPTLAGVAAKPFGDWLAGGAKRIMTSALKPSVGEHLTGKAARGVQTMLDEGVNVTPGGAQTLSNRVSDINTQIEELIRQSNGRVNKGDVAARLQDTIRNYELQANPTNDVRAVEQSMQEFLGHPLLAGQSDMPVQLAQQLKQGTYRALGDKSYGELKGATIEAQKGLAAGLREGISKAEPAVAPLNAKEGDLLNALSMARRRAMMNQNNNPVGLGILNPKTIPYWIMDRSPLAKSLLARMLYSSQGVPGATLGAGLGPYLGSTQENQ